MLIRRLARPMLAATFVSQGAESLASPVAATEAARPAAEGLQKLPDPVSAGIPGDPAVLARITAAAQIGGGLLLASGRVPRFAAAVLAATVIPGNLGAHMFWTEADAGRRADKRRHLMADVSLLGGLLIASADTAGRPSLGWLGRRTARKTAREVGSRVDATREGARRLVGR